MLIEVVALQPTHHYEGVVTIHFKELLTGEPGVPPRITGCRSFAALGPLSALPLVRRAQAAPYRMVVELSLNGHRDFATGRMMLSAPSAALTGPRESLGDL
jgi:hypothetical protein